MMAPDGRCKTFDARANGYVRGEGAGVVVLKRLADALADGDPIYAVIRGTRRQPGRAQQRADGAQPAGPGGRAARGLPRRRRRARQRAVRRGARHRHARSAIRSRRTRSAPCWRDGRPPGSRACIGSVKTNIGHLEAAAGIAGLIKVALALAARRDPAEPALRRAQPRHPLRQPAAPGAADPHPMAGNRWASGRRRQLVRLRRHQRARRAHRSPAGPGQPRPSTARHRIEPSCSRCRRGPPRPCCTRRPVRVGAGIRGGARRPLLHGRRPPRPPRPPVGRGRRLPRRDVRVPGRLPARAVASRGLRRTVPSRPTTRRGLRLPRPGLPVARHGAAAAGRGAGVPRRLSSVRPRDAAVSGQLTCSRRWPRTRNSTEVDLIQPAIFAIQVALAALWRSWGVEPTAVVGHSLGEVAAAHVAGALSLDDAARVICTRARMLRTVRGRGAMMAAELSLAEAQELIAGRESQVAIAGSNSHRSTVLSGDRTVLAELMAVLQRARPVLPVGQRRCGLPQPADGPVGGPICAPASPDCGRPHRRSPCTPR